MTTVNLQDFATVRTMAMEKAIAAAYRVADKMSVRVNPECFEQFARFRWSSTYYKGHGINEKAIYTMVTEYDESFNNRVSRAETVLVQPDLEE